MSDETVFISKLPWGFIILQGNCAVSPISTSTYSIWGGLSIAANELNLSIVDGNEVLMVGTPVVTADISGKNGL